ncbi:MAG: phosphotransferase family protein, partial [Pseudomonadota bacterium]
PPGLETEALLFQAARAAGVPEPQVHYVLQPDDGLGAGFIMEWLEGEALGARIARGDRFAALREHLAYDCGRFMGQIHHIDLDRSGLRERLTETAPETFLQQTWDRYRAYDSPQPMIDYAGRWLAANLPEAPRRALVHNDFRNGNFMVNEREIVAVLDWELAHIGDPMRDLGWICTNSWRFGVTELPVGGFGRKEDLFRGYEDACGVPVDPAAVHFWEVFGSFWWAVGCLGMAEHYRSGPDQTVERPAIGRRSSECQVDCVNLLISGPTELIRAEPIAYAERLPGTTVDMPTIDELLQSVKDFLHDDVMGATDGRLNFMARVAGNSLEIARREWAAGATLRAGELRRLRALQPALVMPDAADEEAERTRRRWALVEALRDGSQALESEALIDYLRFAVVNQAGIDQPRYSGYRTAVRAAATDS